MYREEEELKKRNVVTTCSNNIPKPPITLPSNTRLISSFNVKPSMIPVYEAFKAVSLVESGKYGFSETAMKAFAEYVQRHGRGNNQLKISSYVTGEPTPSAHLCHYSAGNTNEGLVFCMNPSLIKPYDMAIFHGFKGQWASGITCYGCVFNKLREEKK